MKMAAGAGSLAADGGPFSTHHREHLVKMAAGISSQADDVGPLSTILPGSAQVRCVIVKFSGRNSHIYVNKLGFS